jgi:hypothetical protein
LLAPTGAAIEHRATRAFPTKARARARDSLTSRAWARDSARQRGAEKPAAPEAVSDALQKELLCIDTARAALESGRASDALSGSERCEREHPAGGSRSKRF